jgi:AAA+ superfamily predicted ATPase
MIKKTLLEHKNLSDEVIEQIENALLKRATMTEDEMTENSFQLVRFLREENRELKARLNKIAKEVEKTPRPLIPSMFIRYHNFEHDLYPAGLFAENRVFAEIASPRIGLLICPVSNEMQIAELHAGENVIYSQRTGEVVFRTGEPYERSEIGKIEGFEKNYAIAESGGRTFRLKVLPGLEDLFGQLQQGMEVGFEPTSSYITEIISKDRCQELAKSWEYSNIDFSFFGGMSRAKDAILITLKMRTDPKLKKAATKYPQAHTPEHFLFAGPPGYGKTYMIKAVAGELSKLIECNDSKVPIVSVLPGTVKNWYFGRTEYNLCQKFQVCCDLVKGGVPAVVLHIEELDALVGSRANTMGFGTQTEVKSDLGLVLNNFLDGVGYDQEVLAKIIVIATTNCVERLDPSLIRRFQEIQFSGYSREEICEILAIYLTKSCISRTTLKAYENDVRLLAREVVEHLLRFEALATFTYGKNQQKVVVNWEQATSGDDIFKVVKFSESNALKREFRAKEEEGFANGVTNEDLKQCADEVILAKIRYLEQNPQNAYFILPGVSPGYKKIEISKPNIPGLR